MSSTRKLAPIPATEVATNSKKCDSASSCAIGDGQ
jgi:hypothetical protein